MSKRVQSGRRFTRSISKLGSELSGSRGSVAVICIMITLLLGLLLAGIAAGVVTELDLGAQYRDGILAQYLAEAGANRAIVELTTDKSWKNGAESLGGGSYRVTATTDNGRQFRVESTGTVNKAERKTVVSLSASPLQYALFSGGAMELHDRVTGSVGTTGATVAVYGAVSGSIDQNQSALALPPLAVSFTPADYRAAAPLPNRMETGSYALSGLYRVQGDLSLNGDAIAAAGDNITIFVDGSVELSRRFRNNITLIVSGGITLHPGGAADGNMTLYALGGIDVERSSLTGTVLLRSKTGVVIHDGAVIRQGVILTDGDVALNAPFAGAIAAGGRIVQSEHAPVVYNRSAVAAVGLSADWTVDAWNNH